MFRVIPADFPLRAELYPAGREKAAVLRVGDQSNRCCLYSVSFSVNVVVNEHQEIFTSYMQE